MFDIVSPQFSPVHAGTLVLVGLLNVGLGLLLFRIRSDPSVRGLFVFLLGVSMWTIPQGLLLVATSSSVSFVLVYAIHVGASIMSVGLFHFGLSYSGRTEWLRPRRIGLVYLSILPWAVIFLTNPVHEVIHVSESYAGDLLPVIESIHWPYWVYVFYNWSWSGLGTYLLFLEYLDARGGGVYQKQATLVVLAPVIPFVANVLAFGGATEINYTVWGFGATGVLIATAIYQYRWLDLIPIGRDQVIEGMRDGYLVVDDDRRIVDANESAGRFLETPDPVGDRVGDVLPECLELLEGETTERQLSLDGSVVDASVSIVTTRTGEGYVLMLRDVTDKRRAERRFQALIENVSDVITVVEADGTIIYESPSVGDALGYSPEDLVGTSVFDLVHPDDRADARRTFAVLLDDPGAKSRFEYRIRRGDGSWRVFDGVATNLVDNDIVNGIVITSRDVTSRRRREQQLLEQNEYLDEFASVVSHDLQGPLMEIRGSADIAARTGEISHIEHVLDGIDRMERLVDDLLRLARTGRQIDDPEPVELDDVSTAAWGRVWSRDAELVVESNGALLADADRLQQLLENLFRNSVEHGSTSPSSQAQENAVEHSSTSPRSSSTPEDAVERGPEGGRSDVRVTVGTTADGFFVEDDGPGIPPDERVTVFERGYTSTEDGTGIGLAIVRQIVDAHGWTIVAMDGIDGGARFEITGVEIPH